MARDMAACSFVAAAPNGPDRVKRSQSHSDRQQLGLRRRVETGPDSADRLTSGRRQALTVPQ